MYDIAARRASGVMPRAPAFDPMASPTVVEAGKRLVGGRLSPREFDAVVAQECVAWERRQTVAHEAAVSLRR